MASNLHLTETRPAPFDRSRHRLEPMDPEPVQRGACDHCGAKTKRGRSYCGPACRVAYNAILARQGKAVIQALKIWRKHRGGKGTPGEGKLTAVAARVGLKPIDKAS